MQEYSAPLELLARDGDKYRKGPDGPLARQGVVRALAACWDPHAFKDRNNYSAGIKAEYIVTVTIEQAAITCVKVGSAVPA